MKINKRRILVRGLSAILLCVLTVLLCSSAVRPVKADLPSSNTNMVGLVPYFKQKWDNCGQTSVQQVLWWYGLTGVDVNDIGAYLGKDNDTHLWDIDDALAHYLGGWHTYGGFDDAEEAKNWAKSCICAAIPVLAMIEAPGTSNWGFANHFVTLVGYDDGQSAWCLHDTSSRWKNAAGYGYDVWVNYDQFDDCWNHWWTAPPGSNDNRGVAAADLPQGTNGIAQPQVVIKTEGSNDLENVYDDQLPAKLTVELTNVGTDTSYPQVSESQGTDGVTIEVFDGEITWLNLGSFHSFHSLDTGESSDVIGFSGPIQPTKKLQLIYRLSASPGTTLFANIHVQPLSMIDVAFHYWGRLTDQDDWVRTRSVWLDDDSYRAPRGYGVRTLIPERYCCERYSEDSFWALDDDTRPPQFSHPTITPLPVYDSWSDSIAFTMDIVDSDSGVSEYWFTYRWWGEDWKTCDATAVNTLPGGLTARVTIPRSEWINHVGKGLQYAWYAADSDNDRPGDSAGGYSNVYPGPVILDDDSDPPSLYNPATSGDVLESYSGDYLLQISASDYSGNCSISFSYQFNDGTWSDYKPCGGPDVPFIYRFYIPRSEWINHVNEEIHWKVYAEDMDNDRPDDSLGVYSPVYDAGRIINVAPLLDVIGDKTTDEKTLLTFTVTANNHNIPGKTLMFSLGDGSPTGANIDPATGIFTWIPTETQGPGIYLITVKVSDGLAEDSQTITVIVNEVSETRDVQNIMNIVANKIQLPTNAFEGATNKVKENRRNSMLNQLQAIFNDIRNAEALTDPTMKNAEYLSAIDHLNALLDKTDGFAERGAADTKGSGYTPDWIITAQGQASIDPLIRELITTLTTRLT